MNTDKDLPQRMREARAQAHFSRERLAQACGVSRQAIYDYERGVFRPKYEVAKRIAEVLKVDFEYLYYGKTREGDAAALTYKDILSHYLGLVESRLFSEEYVEESGRKQLILRTEDPDLLSFLSQLRNILSIRSSLNKETVSLVIQELLDAYADRRIPSSED